MRSLSLSTTERGVVLRQLPRKCFSLCSSNSLRLAICIHARFDDEIEATVRLELRVSIPSASLHYTSLIVWTEQ